MAKFNYRSLQSMERAQLLNHLAETLTAIKKLKDMRQFLRRLLTPSEIAMLGRRLQIADRLIRGKTYADIRSEIKVGMATIRSVDQWLEQTIGDYHTTYKKIYAKRQAEKRHRSKRGWTPDMPGSFDDVRHRYAGPFLLINLLLDGLDKK